MLDKNLKELDEFENEILVIFELLGNDMQLCSQLAVDGTNKQFWRRTSIRTFFASVEGINFQLKKVALGMASLSHITGIEFSNAEKSLLREESYSVDSKGEASTIKSKIKAEDNLVFSFNMIAKGCNTKSPIDKGENDWNKFKTVLKIRNRLTHPQELKALLITDEEILVAADVARWFAKKSEFIFNLIFEFAENIHKKAPGLFVRKENLDIN